ncbi:MAG: hypothetical protein RL215_2530 [Planctomycetota bacterium]
MFARVVRYWAKEEGNQAVRAEQEGDGEEHGGIADEVMLPAGGEVHFELHLTNGDAHDPHDVHDERPEDSGKGEQEDAEDGVAVVDADDGGDEHESKQRLDSGTGFCNEQFRAFHGNDAVSFEDVVELQGVEELGGDAGGDCLELLDDANIELPWGADGEEEGNDEVNERPPGVLFDKEIEREDKQQREGCVVGEGAGRTDCGDREYHQGGDEQESADCPADFFTGEAGVRVAPNGGETERYRDGEGEKLVVLPAPLLREVTKQDGKKGRGEGGNRDQEGAAALEDGLSVFGLGSGAGFAGDV